MASSDLRDQLQATLRGDYTLERELGGGGMSRVFVAEELRLKRKVVVKVLSPELAQGVSVDRFEREIQTAAALQHANIVPVLSAGDTNGLPFYTMPFVDGESLRGRLGTGPLGVTEVIGVLRDVTRALAYAHQHGVVHRDIKPDNVLLSGGAAVVTDFGIAKAISASRTSASGATLTQMGTSIGTPAYMAPEQAAGDPHVDHRADIYSLGAMAYELLTGQVVFADRTPQRMLAAHMGETPAPLAAFRADVPATLGNLVMSCLAKDPKDRPQSADDIARVLETITSGSGMQSMPPVLLGGPGMFRKALTIYALAFVAVAIAAKAAIAGIGLPDWVFPGALIAMALGLPVVLWTGYVQRVTRRAITMTPTFTPGGTPSTTVHGTIATLALKAAPMTSWYRTTRGVTYALGVFVVMVAAFMGMRAYGIGPFGSLVASGKMAATDQLLVPDFVASGADSALGGGLADALRENLAKSRVLRLTTPKAIGDALELMKLPRDTRVTPAIAQEIAQRTGAKLILTGEVSPLTGGYLVRVRLAPPTGEEITTFRETADGVKDLIPAMDRLGRSMRGKVGESFRIVHAEPPLTAVTTASLSALKKFTEGARANDVEGNYRKAVTLLDEAIALDSTFAMAYRKLSIALRNGGGDIARIPIVLEAGVHYIDHLPEAERLAYLGGYYESGGPHADRAKAIDAYEQLFRRYPEWKTIITSVNLALAYDSRREFARAESVYRAVMVEAPDEAVAYSNIVVTLVLQGKFMEAKRAEDALEARGNKSRVVNPVLTLYAVGDVDSALAVTHGKLLAKDSAAVSQATRDLSQFDLRSGRIREWQQHARIARELYGARRVTMPTSVDSLSALAAGIFVQDQPSIVLRRLDSLTARMPPDQRSTQRLAFLYAMAGGAERARAIVKLMDAAVTDTAERRIQEPQRQLRQGWVAYAAGRYSDAVAEYRASDRLPDGPANQCARCIDIPVALAFDRWNMPDSAIAAYEHYVTTPQFGALNNDALYLALARRRLGELYEAKGNAAKAAEHYRAFIDLWKNADPELQPRVAEARRRLLKLTPVEKQR